MQARAMAEVAVVATVADSAAAAWAVDDHLVEAHLAVVDWVHTTISVLRFMFYDSVQL
jgi:hypothetical protein